MLDLSGTKIHVMGVLNITPDSFSDGGQFVQADAALRRVDVMLAEGVDIIDIGGESTRPGAEDVPLEQELSRVIPLLEAIRQRFGRDVAVSVDTSKPAVMQAAIAAHVDMINDVRALQEPRALAVCAAAQVSVCLMHMQGQPRTMQHNPHYTNVVQDVLAFFQERLVACEQAGIALERIVLDPGFGFGKNLQHNISLLKHFDELRVAGRPLLAGLSRKSMVGTLLGNRPVEQRLQGSVSAAVIAAMKGARIVRVHDVGATVDALKIVQAVL